MIPTAKLIEIEIDQIGNKSDGMTWYQRDVCAYHLHLSRPHNFLMRKLARKW
jgi:hypothetical protein